MQDGLVTHFGFSRDWRIGDPADDSSSDKWFAKYTEYIPPLRALAPTGSFYLQDMTLASLDLSGNAHFVERAGVSGNPVCKWVEYYDGAVYGAANEGVATLNAMEPAWVLGLVRYSPPPGQGIHTYVSVTMWCQKWEDGDWVDGYFTLVIPHQDASYDGPYMHQFYPRPHADFDTLTEGEIISQGRGRSGANGPAREWWVLEQVLDADKFIGGHILVRQFTDGAEPTWWHYYDRKIKLVTSNVAVHCSGARTAFNLSPIRYGTVDGTCFPKDSRPLPSVSGSDWTMVATWGTMQTDAADWTVSVVKDTTAQRPFVTFAYTPAGTSSARPVLWFATEDHDAVVEDAVAGTNTTDDPSTPVLRALSWHWTKNYRNCGGTAALYPMQLSAFPKLAVNSQVEVWMGWQGETDPAFVSQKIATGYVLSDIDEFRDGGQFNGAAQVDIGIGGFDTARLAHKDVLDLRQAGGMTVGDFTRMAGARMGLPASRIIVDPAVEVYEIPLGDPPSVPSLAPQDGDSWEQLLDAIEKAIDVRFTFDKTGLGEFSVDAGRPDYEDGVSEITYTLNEATALPEDFVYDIHHETSGDQFHNVVKIVWGPQDARKEYYWAESTADRKAGVGDDWPKVIVSDDSDSDVSIGDLAQQFTERYYRWQSGIVWTGPMRMNLRPDQFVQVSSVSDIGVATDEVYQIDDVQVTGDAEAMNGTMRVEMTQVWPEVTGPTEAGAGVSPSVNTSSFNARGFN